MQQIPPSDKALQELASQLGQRLKALGWTLVTAESCTGGWVAKVITDIEGSSGWFERGFVTYTNIAKQEQLGVQAAILEAHGAVSSEVVLAMAAGALTHSYAQLSLAITGIAGPGGGTPFKPVGTVWFAWDGAGQPAQSEQHIFQGDREAVRRQAVAMALTGVLKRLD